MAPVAVRTSSEAFGVENPTESQARTTRARTESSASNDADSTQSRSPLLRRTYGVITRVSMMNFMCHSNLTIKLGPEINLIMGRNGSGKSTILTALSSCLGGKATNTNRATRIGALVKEGEEKALIEVEFSNEGDQGSFMPQVYGSKIIVERSIRRNGATAYKIKNASNKTISTRRSDLSDILEHFQIFIDNPFTILTQDMARAFLTASTPDSKFKHFYSGLQFDKVANLQFTATEQLKMTEAGLHSYKTVVSDLKQKRNDRRGLLKRANEYEQSLQRAKVLRSYLMWENAREVSSQAKKVGSEIAEAERKKKEYTESADFFEARKKKLTEEIGLLEEEKLETDTEASRLTSEKRDTLKEIHILDESIKNVQRDSAGAKDQMKQKEISGRAIQQKIDAIVERSIETYGKEQAANEKRKLDIAMEVSKYANLLSAEEDRENELSLEVGNLTRNNREEIESTNSSIRVLQSELQDLERRKRELAAGESSKYQGYSREMKMLCERIQNKQSSFTDQVIGPVGLYISLKDAAWSPQLEAILNPSLNGFIVFNDKDSRLLLSMIADCRADCSVYKRGKDLFNFADTMPDTRYKTIYDVLEFKNEYVKRFLIDQHYIESVVLIDDRNEAEDYMKRRPHNVRNAVAIDRKNPINGFTIGGAKMASVTPLDGRGDRPRMEIKDTQLLIKANEAQIISKRNQISELRAHVGSLTKEVKDAEDKLRECTRQVSLISTKKRLQEKAMNDLSARMERDDQREDLEKADAFRQQLESINHEKSMYEDQYITAEARVQSLLEDKRSLHKKVSALDKKIQVQSQLSFKTKEGIKALELKLQSISNDRADFVNNLEEYDSRLAKLTTNKAALEEKYEALSNKARELTGSVEPTYMPENETKESINAQILYCQQIVQQVEAELGRRSYDDVVRLVNEAEAEYNAAREQYAEVTRDFRRVNSSKNSRQENYEEFKLNLCSSVARSFRQNLANRGFEGDLSIDLDQEKLNMKVGPSDGKLRDVSTLSGGEKSFSQVALLVAIWVTMNSRLVALDEFDVFMDKINRRISLSMVMDALKLQSNVQSIFITPQDVDIEAFTGDSNHVHIHKMADPERSSGPYM